MPNPLERIMLDFSGRYVRKGRGLVKPPVDGPPGGQEEERMREAKLLCEEDGRVVEEVEEVVEEKALMELPS